ncbi:hypothetical protein HYE68_003963 [Fusarium pseudograminearum]|nr:hypothetical protein HYE68_003963 [Fusarium pseudograminearum]
MAILSTTNPDAAHIIPFAIAQTKKTCYNPGFYGPPTVYCTVVYLVLKELHRVGRLVFYDIMSNGSNLLQMVSYGKSIKGCPFMVTGGPCKNSSSHHPGPSPSSHSKQEGRFHRSKQTINNGTTVACLIIPHEAPDSYIWQCIDSRDFQSSAQYPMSAIHFYLSSLRTTPVPALGITHQLIGIEPTAEIAPRRFLVIAPGNLVAINTFVQYHKYKTRYLDNSVLNRGIVDGKFSLLGRPASYFITGLLDIDRDSTPFLVEVIYGAKEFYDVPQPGQDSSLLWLAIFDSLTLDNQMEITLCRTQYSVSDIDPQVLKTLKILNTIEPKSKTQSPDR